MLCLFEELASAEANLAFGIHISPGCARSLLELLHVFFGHATKIQLANRERVRVAYMGFRGFRTIEAHPPADTPDLCRSFRAPQQVTTI